MIGPKPVQQLLGRTIERTCESGEGGVILQNIRYEIAETEDGHCERQVEYEQQPELRVGQNERRHRCRHENDGEQYGCG